MAAAQVLGADPESDLAVLQVAAKNLQAITFADPASVQVGTSCWRSATPWAWGRP